VRGTVVSKVNFYRAGNLTEPPQGIAAATECDFVFYRRFAKWRLVIDYPDPAFAKGSVWSTIMPLDAGGFISVISFPPRPGVPENKGNAYVTVMTNQFFPFELGHIPHAAWLVFNLDDILEKAPRLGTLILDGMRPDFVCPPIWKFNPRVHDMRVNSHRIIRTNDAIIFWNTGRSVARDANGQVILENGQPKVKIRPPPLDEGFAEMEYRPSSDFLNQELGIPKSVVLTTWSSFRDEKEVRGIRMVPIIEQRIENKGVEFQTIPESLFLPEWTNSFAVVADFRREGSITGQALSYVTKATNFDSSERELSRRKQESDTQHAIAQPPKSIPKSLIILSLFIVTVIPLGVWWYSKRK
jgi:hypothetical protein